MDVERSLWTETRRAVVRVSVIGILLMVGLLWLASLRFPVTLADPPQPTPDYTVRTGWCLVGVALVVIIAVATLTIAWRRPERLPRVASIGLIAMLACGVGCAVIAIVVSTP
ncbi:sterol desaturase/sphingolipid hydroxylase (fatty acid hydroxylase superfamily) [Agromyces hippuratus]|uniref:Sterol desaturase/sphingolipid hydroxylase (Fatty acid hydroxylase superfamily) n=1 Tax=Agromyces hippuratus TaxID=286438 RepID=A0A852WQ77_9MICO|nr:hypothetical protein [Agromyces hippuratus]NYG19897.1 sterol desaturase/sphingolipid hydroxylase (fatty acid hydroxylase superfamily) [Agromyces hippuratus]